ncbi:MAG: hypothetical protein NC080_04815 [Paraprevotella sp.]|nr:hypothetical protein [Paraprevotella sp.]
MKRHLQLAAAFAMLCATMVPVEMQARKKEKASKEDQAVKVTLYLNSNNGEAPGRVMDGYLRSAMANDPDFLEMSATVDGERVRYASEDVDSLTIMDNLRYVKRKCRGTGLSANPKIRWVRVFYEGRGIDVYSAYFVTATKVNNTTIIETTMQYFISLADDVAVAATSINCSNPYYTGDPDAIRGTLAHYFGKIYDYGEFAERIKAKEFNTLSEVVKAWENEYSEYPVSRVDGKFKDAQIGAQKTVLAESAAKSAGWKRMKNEVVFARHTRSIQAGVSPDVASWSRHIRHDGSNYRLNIPPVGVYADICFADFSKFGSIGYVLGVNYSSFRYDWQWDNGYGPKRQDTRCNRFDMEAGLSWHITICRNFEAYVRAMVDLSVIGDNTVDHESGEKNISNSKFNTYVSFAAVGGLRYYFCKSVGIYVEGGYDIGYASAGLSFRF